MTTRDPHAAPDFGINGLGAAEYYWERHKDCPSGCEFKKHLERMIPRWRRAVA